MPTYVYKFVETGETIEVQQSFSDPTLTEVVNPRTGVAMAVKKVFQPVGVTFKGSGFYKTDSRSGAKRTSPGADTASTDTTSTDTSSTDASSTTTTASDSASTPATTATPAPSTSTPGTPSTAASPPSTGG